MMELVKQWLLGITGAAILAALAEGIMPEGGIKQIGKLACGVMLLTAILMPLKDIDTTVFSEHMDYDSAQSHLLREETQVRIKQLIEDEFSAYSMDKAQKLGISCEIRVRCRQQGESGIFLPEQAEISGAAEEERRAVAVMLCTDLGLSEDGLLFEEGGRR